MKKVWSLFGGMIIAIMVCFPVKAQIASTKAPTVENGIYIAGNPKLYPLEYYNEKTEQYEGILPQIYEQISRETGLELTYIAASKESRQKELAENLQVEVVSAYKKGEIDVSDEIELFSYKEGKEAITICVGLTEIASEEVRSTLRATLETVGQETWATAVMSIEENRMNPAVPVLIVVCVVLVLALLSIAILALYKTKKKKSLDMTKTTDKMTGIGNKLYFEECYAHHLLPELKALYYIAYFHLDFNKIEVYYDIAEVEEFQRYAAGVISNAMGDNDFVSRIDDGVFVACFMAPDEIRAKEKAREIVDGLNTHKICAEQKEYTQFNCGLYPLEQQDVACEIAIFNAKQGYLAAVREEKQVVLSDAKVMNQVALRSRLQKKLISAIDNEEFHIYLQFIYDVHADKFCGAEVLSRWHNPQEGVQSPGVYIEELKAAGMIEKLDFYIFEKTCHLLSQWAGSQYKNLYLSCNFTRTTLSAENYLERFKGILDKYTFDRKKIMVEITEDSLVKNRENAYQNISGIKELGCRVALDDLGAGYTSFVDLCDYPIDVIKIDSLIVNNVESGQAKAVLTGISQMAQGLGIQTLYEGVETESAYNMAKEIGCDYIQGYLFSRVLPIEVAMEFYEKEKRNEIDSQ